MTSDQEPAIKLVGLRRVYGDRAALDDVDPGDRGRRLARRPRPQRRRQDDAAADPRHAAAPDRRRGHVLGCKLPDEAWKLRGKIGYLGHEPLLYRDLSGRENLRFHAKMYGITGARAGERIEELLDAVKLSHRGDERTFEFSAGMRQRLAICRCVLHEPELLLLDEPDSNLDIEGREIARTLIGPGLGHTRVVVTHDPERYLPEADQVLRLDVNEPAAIA